MKLWLLALAATAAAQQTPLPLSVEQAIAIATARDGNTRIEIARQMVQAAEARTRQARSALLPQIDGVLGYQNLTRNLAAFGIQFPSLPFPGFSIPTFAGPFGVADARLNASQPLLDLASLQRWKASRSSSQAAKLEEGAARNAVMEQVARAYLGAQLAEARLDTQAANVRLAEALRALADSLRRAGTGTGIEVTRAEVQLANERQKLQAANNDHRRARLHLLRAMGLDLTAEIQLTSKLRLQPTEPLSIPQAVEQALATRPDWKAQLERESAARLSRQAAAFERLPSVVALGDYGAIGTGVSAMRATRTVGVGVRIPVFSGNRRQAREAESAALLGIEQARTRDLRQQVELEVRLAMDALASAIAQVATAEEGVSLGEKELEQAQRRYEAGLTNSLEVTDAQTRLARARENRLAALYQHSMARLELGSALGATERYLP